jgi:hypothetical protein
MKSQRQRRRGGGMLTMILRFLMRSSLNGDSWSMAISSSRQDVVVPVARREQAGEKPREDERAAVSGGREGKRQLS